MEISQTGDYFLIDGESESMGDQTDEDNVEAVSDGEDTGLQKKSRCRKRKQNKKTEASGRQLLMIIPTLLAVCIMAFAAIFVFCKKRQIRDRGKAKKAPENRRRCQQ